MAEKIEEGNRAKDIEEPFLKDYIEVEFKGKKLKFYTISMEDTFNFAGFLFVNPKEFFTNDNELAKFIGLSLRVKPERIRKTSPGFKMFALKKVLEVIDFPFLLKNSASLGEEIEKLSKELGVSLPKVSSESEKPSDIPPDISSKDSPLNK